MADFFDADRMFDFEGDPPVPAPSAAVRSASEPSQEGSGTATPAPRQMVPDDQPVTVNYLSEVGELLADCERIRKHAMRINRRSGEEEIFNPMLFEKAVARRQSILASAVKLHRDLWNDHAQQEFYRLMVQTIAQESPAAAHRLIAELRKINSPVLEVLDKVAI